MKSIYFVLFSLFVVVVSCNKNDDNNDNPPTEKREWFKLKAISGKTLNNNNGSVYSSDSTDIEIDSANNKIIFRKAGGTSSTLKETFTYNSQYQVVLYEKESTYDRLYISRMEFVRDADGKVTKVLSTYKNGLMPSSEGLVKYDKRGDTTFVTFIDSTLKHPEKYSDAQDFYETALVNDKIVSLKVYDMKSTGGFYGISLDKYEYDAAGNMTKDTYQYGAGTPRVYTYQRGSETPKELQKFLAQWSGDLLWFWRSKLFGFSWKLLTVPTITGNVLVSTTEGSTVTPYTNTFDASGNLSSASYQYGTLSTSYTETEKYYYRP